MITYALTQMVVIYVNVRLVITWPMMVLSAKVRRMCSHANFMLNFRVKLYYDFQTSMNVQSKMVAVIKYVRM